MGNISSSSDGTGRRRHSRRRSNSLPTVAPSPPPPPPPPSLPPPPPPSSEIPTNRIVFAAATPYPNPNSNPNPNPHQLYQYPGYYPPPPGTMAVPSYDHHQHHHHHYPPLPYHHPLPWTTGGRYPYGGPMMPPPPPYVEHQKAVTIRNDVNLKKESLKLEPDLEKPGRFLVTFTFDATVSGRITVIFFAKESEECNLTATKEEILPPITMDFEKGLGQKFRQASGSGIDFSAFEDLELFKPADTDIYPLAVKAEAADDEGGLGSKNAQITQAVYEKDKGEIKIRVVKQILWVNGMRYELQEIYGIGNTVDGDDDAADANDPGKECVICLSEPRDTTVLPCRHMCMCSGCAKVLRFQTNRCPICRQPVERLLEIKVHGNSHNGNNNGEGASEQE